MKDLTRMAATCCGRPAARKQGIFVDEMDLTLKDFNKRTEIRF